jgi:hypothetical protein
MKLILYREGMNHVNTVKLALKCTSIANHCQGPTGGSMSKVVGLPNNSYKSITNMAWDRTRLCKLQKRVHSTRSRK